MFDIKQSSQIKNDKIQRWRIELAAYNFDIQYRAGKQNLTADLLSRPYCSAIATDGTALTRLHNVLCRPGITRMYHYLCVRNLPYSIDDVRKVTAQFRVCNECKPQFYKPPESKLIKAAQPFERISIDFRGPLPSSSPNNYFLTIVDEFSRFPFVYPWRDMTSSTVISCLQHLFSICGIPGYVHSDRGLSFLAQDTTKFLHDYGIATSRTPPYHPQGNGQCESFNGIIWKNITLALKTANLKISQWEEVIPTALHTIRSLLSTATKRTPHERFFAFTRKTTTGNTLPTWLAKPGAVLMKRSVRKSKYDPLVDEVQANPSYAYVRFPDGRTSAVSICDLAPRGSFEPKEGEKELTERVLSNSHSQCQLPLKNISNQSQKADRGKREGQNTGTLEEGVARTFTSKDGNLTTPSATDSSISVFTPNRESSAESCYEFSSKPASVDSSQLRRSTRNRKAPERFRPR